MDMAHTSPRLSEMETNHLCITVPVETGICLHAPYSREGATRVPAPFYANHDTRLF